MRATALLRPRVFSRQSSSQTSGISFSKIGLPDQVLSLKNEALLEPKDGEVKIRMLAAPVHHSDIGRIRGLSSPLEKLPAYGGVEGVGVVIQVGGSVSGLKVNDKVVAVPFSFGTWQSHAVVRADNLVQVNSELSSDAASSMSIGPVVAHRLLSDFAALKKGDVVVQNGAAGLVGQSVIQLAASRGIKTINVIGDHPEQGQTIERLKSIGAYAVVNESFSRSFGFRKLFSDLPAPSLALNGGSAASALEMARVLRPGSTMVTYGGQPRQPLVVPSGLFVNKNLTLSGFNLRNWLKNHSAAEWKEAVKAVEQLILAGKLKIFVERHSPENFKTALARTMDPSQDRKVVFSWEKQ